MKKKLLTVKGEYMHGVFIPSKIYITKSTLEHKLNKGKSIKLGWSTLDGGCPPEDKPVAPDGEEGVYICIGSDWVWFPA